MAKQKTTEEVIPSARRLIKSLRDVGYDFVHAVADVVDNSIMANAGRVDITMEFDGEDSWIRVVDDGTGMSGSTLKEAMRFGTEREYELDELGRFGLGLKTASLSQCSRLTVASRLSASIRRIEVRQWDLDYVEKANRWAIINVPPEERPGYLVEPLKKGTGTVVLWEQLDRVLGYKIPWGERARTGFFSLADDLEQHLAMVFHRFLSGEAKRRKKLRIAINDTPVEPWDPFAREEAATKDLPGKELEITGDDGLGIVAYSPFILPPQEKFSSLQAFSRYAGPLKWNYQQGFYIYRSDRMIQSGGWCRMRTSDEHTKYARVALDFRPDLDSAFDLNVVKARVNLPADLRIKLKPLVEGIAKKARKAYTPAGGGSPGGGGASGTGHPGGSGGTGGAGHTGGSGGSGRAGSVKAYIGQAIEDAAGKANELPALNRIKASLKEDEPDTSHEIGW